MRVSTKVLATASSLLVLSSCVTPPPMDRGPAPRYASSPSRTAYPEPARYDRPAAQGGYDNAPYDDRGYDDGRGYYSPPPRGRLSVLLGGRSLDEDGFSPTDDPGVFALEFNQVPQYGGLGFEFGLGFGFDDEDGVTLPNNSIGDLELRQAEIYAGVRAELGNGPVRPYIGGGGTFLSTTTTILQGFTERDEEDNVLGAYLHGGIQADLNEFLFLGLDYRHVFASDYDFNGTEVPADYDQLALVIGFSL